MHFKVLSSQALASALKAAFAFTDNWDTEELDRPPVCFSFDSNTLTIHSCYKEMYGIYAHFEAFVDIAGAYQLQISALIRMTYTSQSRTWMIWS